MSVSAPLGEFLFRYRSYTPLPFLAAMVVFADPSARSLLLGLPVAVAGELTRLWGVSIVGAETRVTGAVGASRLVTSGPYAHVRNPLYVGNMLLYTGIGVASWALVPWLQIAAAGWFAFQYGSIVRREEKFLRERFGERYRRYAAAVPRFVPTLRPLLESAPPGPKPDWEMAFRSEVRTIQAIVLTTAVILLRGLVRG